MTKNTPIKEILDRAFDNLEIILGCQTTKPKPKRRKKCCGGSKCKSSGFVADKTKEKE